MTVPIRAIAMDVDGVLTDGTMWLDAEGRETKRISFADVMGVSIGRRAGLQYALISGESGGPLQAIAAKFGIADVYGGCKDKAAALRDFSSRIGVGLEEICYIGDDINDVEAMRICGLAAAPGDAHSAAVAAATIVTKRPSGAGSVREVVDHVLDEGGVA